MTKKEEISTEHIGQRSFFLDVPATEKWFNADMVVTSLGMMKFGLSGDFSPKKPVSGADLFLAVLELRNIPSLFTD